MMPPDRCRQCPLANGLDVSALSTPDILTRNDALFRAIAARDAKTLADTCAPEFHFKTADGARGDRPAFLEGVRTMPYEIRAITNEDLVLRLDGDRAVLCGIQRATVNVEGQGVKDEQAFCDRWEKRNGQWVVTYAGVPPQKPG